jgi:hypothetical protein
VSQVYSRNDTLLFQGVATDSLCEVSEECGEEYAEPPDLGKDVREVPPIKSTDPVVKFDLCEQDRVQISEIIASFVDAEWRDVYLCPGYRMRLRPVRDAERLDSDGQTHVFEVQFPIFDSRGLRARRYARVFYNKLKPEVQEKFKLLVQDYLDEGWWWIKGYRQVRNGVRVLPPANVFCVGGGDSKQKLRLVCDLRPANACLPLVSSETDPIVRILASVLMGAPPCLVVSDARAAFYKIKTDGQVLIELEGPTGSYYSDRITFGISSGPGICNFALGNLRRGMLPTVGTDLRTFSLFVDDSVIGGGVAEAARTLRKWVGLLAATGNDITWRKLRVITANPVSAAGQFGEECTIANQAQLLGLRFYYRQDSLVLDCDRSLVRKAALEFVANAEEAQATTKARVFEISGRLGYDPLGGHAEERAIADALRSIFGSLPVEWKDLVRFRDLPISKRNMIATVFEWMLDVLPRLPVCDHSVKVRTDATKGPIDVEFCGCSDASDTGGGYVLYMNGLKIVERAWFWKGTTLGALDVNLKELEAQLELLKECARIMPGQAHDREFLLQRYRFRFKLYTDNRATCAWMNDCRNISSGVGMRRIYAIRDILASLRQVAVVEAKYLEGALNVEADYLSRMFCRPSSFNARVPLAHLLADKRYSEVLDELSAVGETNAEVIPPLSVRLEDEQLSYRSMLHKVRLLREVLRGWWLEATKRPSPTAKPASRFDDEMALVRISQSGLLKGSLRTYFTCPQSIPMASPIQFDSNNRLLTRRIPQADGSSYAVPLVPQASGLAKAIARKVHEEAGHAGTLATKLRVEGYYYIPAAGKLIESIRRHCAVCQRALARQNWQVAPEVTMEGLDPQRMSHSDPFAFIGIDYLSAGDGIKIFSVTCLFSRSVWWRVVEAEDLMTAVVCIRMAQEQFGKINTIVCDQGSYFRSDRFVKRLRREIGEVDVILIPARSPWVGGIYEREHREGLRLARILLTVLNKKGRDLKFGSVGLQERVDRLMLVMNTRPLGVSHQSIVVTPDLLAWGRTRRVHDFERARQPQDIQKVRNFFLDHAWKSLKARSWVSIAARSRPQGTRKQLKDLKEGDGVLVFSRQGKLDPVIVGHFSSWQGNKLWVRIGEKLSLEHHYNVIPLEDHWQEPEEPNAIPIGSDEEEESEQSVLEADTEPPNVVETPDRIPTPSEQPSGPGSPMDVDQTGNLVETELHDTPQEPANDPPLSRRNTAKRAKTAIQEPDQGGNLPQEVEQGDSPLFPRRRAPRPQRKAALKASEAWASLGGRAC